MKPFTLLLLIAGLGLSIFGYWGMFTRSGDRCFDEMDGMYPFFALVAGIILLLIVGIVLLIDLIKRRKKKQN